MKALESLRRLWMLLFVGGAMLGCSLGRPSDVIPEDTLEALLYDYHLAKVMGDQLPYNENYKRTLYLQGALDRYGVTQADFDSSMVWYARHTEVLTKIYAKVSRRMFEEQERINKQMALREQRVDSSQLGDSVDVWGWQRLIALSATPPRHIYTFSLSADTTFHDRDTLVWEVDYRSFLPTDSGKKVPRLAMGMQIIYDRDTLSMARQVEAFGKHSLTLYADTLGTLREVRGFLHVNDKDFEGILLGTGISMMRYHCRDTVPFAVRMEMNRAAAQAAADTIHASNKADSLLPQAEVTAATTTPAAGMGRNTPEQMNKPRTNENVVKRPEQIETEQRIQEDREQLRRQRRMQQRTPQRSNSQVRR